MERVHTKRFRYWLVGIAVAILDGFFAFRAAVAAYVFFQTLVGQWEAYAPAVIVFVGTLAFGFIVTTHPTEMGKGMWWITGSILGVDWIGAIYLAYLKTGFIDPRTPAGFAPAAGALFLCIIVLLAFGGGYIMENLHAGLSNEVQTTHDTFVKAFSLRMERRAMVLLEQTAQKDPSVLATYTPRLLQQYSGMVESTAQAQYSPQSQPLEETTPEQEWPELADTHEDTKVNVTYNDDNTLHTVQFPGKEPVIVDTRERDPLLKRNVNKQ